MAIKNAKYEIRGGDGFDVYHYVTNSGVVEVLDKEKVKLGTIDEFAFKGKVVTSGAVKDLKISGLYKISSITGIPTVIPSGKIALLSVKSVGEINNPEFINYQIVYQNGDIYNKTVVGGIETEWTNGGTKLENTLTTLMTNFGDISKLNTDSKSNMVGAINEVNTNLKATAQTLDELNTSFLGHNHDSRYIKKDGDDISGNINILSTSGFYSKMSNGTTRKMLTVESNGDLSLGNTESILNLYSTNNLLHNGMKVWTEVNDGQNSGLDADLLDGIEGEYYTKNTVENTFSENNIFQRNVSILETLNLGENTVVYEDTNKDFSIKFKDNNTDYRFKIDKKYNMFASGLYLDDGSKNGENRIVFGKTTDKGSDWIGFLRNPAYNDEVWFYHWGTSGGYQTGRFFYASPSTNTVNFDKEISISGRRIFMQPNQPTSNVTVGSIWIA